MTTFDIAERSRELSRPAELYKFTRGSSDWLYTSAGSIITAGVESYLPESITRGSILKGPQARKRELVVTLPSENSFAQDYIGVVPGQRASLQILRIQRSQTSPAPPTFTTSTKYRGQVTAVNFSDNGRKAEIKLRSAEAAFGRTLPSYSYQGQCNHMLYGAGCKANPDLHKHQGNVSDVDANVITLDGAGASGHDFVGGYVKPLASQDFRLIIAQSGDDLTLLIPFGFDLTLQQATAFAGCDHNVDGDCANVFDNVIECACFRWVPTKNIFATGLD